MRYLFIISVILGLSGCVTMSPYTRTYYPMPLYTTPSAAQPPIYYAQPPIYYRDASPVIVRPVIVPYMIESTRRHEHAHHEPRDAERRNGSQDPNHRERR